MKNLLIYTIATLLLCATTTSSAQVKEIKLSKNRALAYNTNYLITNEKIALVEISGFNPLLHKFVVDSKDTVPPKTTLPPGFISFIPTQIVSQLLATLPGESFAPKIKLPESVPDIDPSFYEQMFSDADTVVSNTNKIVAEFAEWIMKLQPILLSTDYKTLSEDVSKFDFISYKNQLTAAKAVVVNLQRRYLLHASQMHKKELTHELHIALGKYLDDVSQQIHKADTSFTIDDFNTLQAAINNYKNNPSYLSFPIQIGDADKIINVQVIPNESSALASSYKTKLVLKHENSDGFSFSGAFNIISNNAYAHSQISTVQKSDGLFYPQAEKLSQFAIGIATMIHWQPYNNLFQVGIGPSLTYNSSLIPGLNIGVGITTGDRDRFSITMGTNFSYIGSPSSITALGEGLAQAPESWTVDKLHAGIFLAFGYSFLSF